MRRAIALGGIVPVAEPTREDVPRRPRTKRRGRSTFAPSIYAYGSAPLAWQSFSSGIVTASAHPGIQSSYTSLIGSNLRQRVLEAKMSWDAQHAAPSTRVRLGYQERQELNEILSHDLAHSSYAPDLLDTMQVNLVGLRVIFVPEDSCLGVL